DVRCVTRVTSSAVFLVAILRPPGSSLFPYTTLFRSGVRVRGEHRAPGLGEVRRRRVAHPAVDLHLRATVRLRVVRRTHLPHLDRSEEHTSELQSRENLVCRLLLEKKKKRDNQQYHQH